MSYQQCLLNCVNILEDSQWINQMAEWSVGQEGGPHENMIIDLTPWREPHTLWYYQMRLRLLVKPRFYLSSSNRKTSAVHAVVGIFLKNFDISQVVRENCCIFVLTTLCETELYQQSCHKPQQFGGEPQRFGDKLCKKTLIFLRFI